jgi:hypothetical protein
MSGLISGIGYVDVGGTWPSRFKPLRLSTPPRDPDGLCTPKFVNIEEPWLGIDASSPRTAIVYNRIAVAAMQILHLSSRRNIFKGY